MNHQIAQILDLGWIGLFCTAFLYNLRFRPDLKPLVLLSLILTMGWAITHYVTRAMFEGLQPSQQIMFQYLLWCAGCIFIALTTIAVQVVKNFKAFWQIRLVLLLLTIDALGNFVMHIDQNVVALNDWGPPNSAWQDRWWLWYLYSATSNFNNAVYGLILFLPVGMELDFKMTYRKLLKQLSSAAHFFTGSDFERRISCIGDMLKVQQENVQVAVARQAVASAQELIYRSDETGQDHSASIKVLLDFAAIIAADGKTEVGTNYTSYYRKLWQRFKGV